MQRVNEAQGDVARFNRVLDEYNRNPGVTRTRLYYEMYENVFGDAEGHGADRQEPRRTSSP